MKKPQVSANDAAALRYRQVRCGSIVASWPMVPEIKSHSLIGGEALDAYRPEDPENFNVILRLIIGPRGQPGEESFDITICTPKSLALECTANGFVLGRHRLVLSTYDPSLIMSVVIKLVARCSGPSWNEIGSKIARIAYWEFEDYQGTG